jgi:nicotinate phosphoribosyltransferase
VTSTALNTDHYELTMLDAALQAGRAGQRAVFEVFTRRLPPERPFGVFAGLARLMDALDDFVFEDTEIAWLEDRAIVSPETLKWLGQYRFEGSVHAYSEGELYAAGSPVLTVEGSFGEAVLLETLVLSILNHDSAVAAAASILSRAAGDRPVIEMGSRRADPEAAVAAARAGYLAGLASTSNLEAGRRYGVPTAGTSAHAFVLLFPDEREAFSAQVAAFGPATTLLVDTYQTDVAIRLAVEAAGPSLAAVRIDSGDLRLEAVRARALLDSLGATQTKVILTGDLDDGMIRELADYPADGYGVGTSVVTGLGHPSAGFVYKLVSVDGRPVEKHSPGKATAGGRKWAWRVPDQAEEHVTSGPGPEPPAPAPAGGRLLQSTVVSGGRRLALPSLEESRALHRRSVAELASDRPLVLVRSGPPLP